MNTLKTYAIWSADKVAQYAYSIDQELDADFTTYAGLLTAEALEDCGISSDVVTADIEGLLAAIYNETDRELCYEEVPQEIIFKIYKSCDADYTQSIEDGAVYALNTAGVFEAKGNAYAALKTNAYQMADCLGRVEDMSYVVFDAYGLELACGNFEGGL